MPTRVGQDRKEHSMGIQSIDHFEIVANDVQRTLDFYRNLGFEVDDKASRGESRTR